MKNCKSTVGCSKITPFKQEDLKHLLSSQIGKAYGVYLKHREEDWYEEDMYIDCTAGDMSKDRLTSPQIFLESLSKFKRFQCRLFLIETDKKTFSLLQQNYDLRFKNKIETTWIDVRLRNKDIQERLPKIGPNIPKEGYETKNHPYRYGLIYFDPNGFKIKDYESLFYFLHGNPRMDVILNINISKLNALRQITKAKGFMEYNTFYLATILRSLNKKYIWIRDNSQVQIKSAYTFVMIFGTNMPNYDIGKKNCNFYPIDSVKGQEIIHKHNLLEKEKRNGNLKI